METKNYVIICDKIDSLIQKEMKQLEVSNFSLTVEKLADEIATFLNIDKNSFDIVNFGRSLDYNKTLDSYGIENGTILYLLKKVSKDELKHSGQDETEEINLSTLNQGMCISLKSALLNSSFRQVIENLSDFENRENLMTVSKELKNDPSLFGILNDSELLHAYISKNNIKNVLKKYPHFLEVATYVSAAFHEESNSTSMNRFIYSLENHEYEDIEEMEESDASSISSSSNTNNSLPRISDPSLTSIIMEAYRHRQNQDQNTSTNQSSLNNTITHDMLQQALDSTNSPSQNLRNRQHVPRTAAQILIGWAPQLTQLRELGITDDIVAIQALEATNGDIQAAINIIFGDNS